ncbi:MAG: NAD(P)-dependent oxidoreductase [Chloroflexota bacterium]
MTPFHIGISADFKTNAPGRMEPVLAELFDPLPYISYEYFEAPDNIVSADAITHFDGVITLAYHYTAETLKNQDRLAVIARWGVGYDMIDVPATTEADVLLAITIDAVRKPVAEAILTLCLSLAKQLPAKDKLVRTGRWDLKAEIPSLGMSGKTVGSVGMGNIGTEMFRLFGPFDLGRRLVYDPYLDPDKAAALNVELVDLQTVFRESDFVTINCPLTDETAGLVNADLFGLMKPTAYFVNTARGPIVNQADLTTALSSGQIAGAGLDVFEEEPISPDHPLVQMENVILGPHALAWTDDLYIGNGIGACKNVLTILHGKAPNYTVNKDVIHRSGFQQKLTNLQQKWQIIEGG